MLIAHLKNVRDLFNITLNTMTGGKLLPAQDSNGRCASIRIISECQNWWISLALYCTNGENDDRKEA